MMYNAAHLIGANVYGSNSTKVVSQLRDIYFDQSLSQIKGVFLGDRGVWRQRLWIVSTKAGFQWEDQALYVGNAQLLEEGLQESETRRWISWDSIIGRELHVSHKRCGRISEVYFNASRTHCSFHHFSWSQKYPLHPTSCRNYSYPATRYICRSFVCPC